MWHCVIQRQVIFILYASKFQCQITRRRIFVESLHARTTLHVLGRVAPTSFMIWVQLNLDQKLNQEHAELRCTKLNGRGYTVDDADWSTTLGLRASFNDVTVTQCLRNRPVQIGHNLFEFLVSLKLLHDFRINSCIDKVLKITHFVFQ